MGTKPQRPAGLTDLQLGEVFAKPRSWVVGFQDEILKTKELSEERRANKNMNEPLIGGDGPSYTSTSNLSEGNDTFSQLSIRTGDLSSSDTTGRGVDTDAQDGGNGSLLESIDYLPANNAPWRKHITKQEKLRNNW